MGNATQFIAELKKILLSRSSFQNALMQAQLDEEELANQLNQLFSAKRPNFYSRFKQKFDGEFEVKIWPVRFRVRYQKSHQDVGKSPSPKVIPIKPKPRKQSFQKPSFARAAAKIAMYSILVGISLPTVVYPAAAFVVHLYAVARPNLVEDILDQEKCVVRPIIKSQGRVIGPLSLSSSKGCKASLVSYVTGKASIKEARYIVPHLSGIEGAADGGVLRLGNDPLAGLRIVKTLFTQQRLIGGSGLGQQLIRNVYGRQNVLSQSFFTRLVNKGTDIIQSAVITAHLTPEELDQVTATHFICAVGAKNSKFGTAIGGVLLCADLLFNKKPEELTDAEACVIAATSKRPFQVGPYLTKNVEKQAERRWRRIKKRAHICAEKLANPKKQRAIIHKEISSMPMPRPDLVSANPNPLKRASRFLGNGTASLTTELKIRFGDNYLEQQAIDLSVKPNNVKFVADFEKALTSIQQNRSEFKQCLVNCFKSDVLRADVLGVIVKNSRVVHYYSSGDPFLFSGPIRKEPSSKRWVYANPSRPIGSLGKMPAALVLGQKYDKLCNRFFRGVKNPMRIPDYGVGNCNKPKAWKSLHSTYKWSWNLPVIWGLIHQKTELHRMIELLGLTPSSTKVSFAYQQAFGLVTASPAKVMQIAHAINNGLNRWPAIAALPTLLSAGHSDVSENPTIDASRYFKNTKARKRIMTALKAPLQGTLAGVGKELRKRGIHNAIGKSGTSETSPKSSTGIRDKYMVSSFTHNGNSYQIFLLVGSKMPNQPLGHHITGSALAPLWRVLIDYSIQN